MDEDAALREVLDATVEDLIDSTFFHQACHSSSAPEYLRNGSAVVRAGRTVLSHCSMPDNPPVDEQLARL